MTRFSCLDVATAAGLEEGRRRGNEQPFRCPRHGEDRHPSLMVNVEKDTWLCGPCGQSGTAWKLAAFLSGHPADDKEPVKDWLREHGLLSANGRQSAASAKRTIACTYPYRDETGTLLCEAVREEPKKFWQRRPNGKGYLSNVEGVRPTPYALERLVDRTPDVFGVEGEKDAERLWSHGVPATTNIGGALKWKDELSETLKTQAGVERFYIVPDHDEPGHRHAQKVAASMSGVGIEVHVVHLPGLHDGPPATHHGRDVSNWLDEGHSVDELRRHATAAPIWTLTTATAGPAIPSHWQRLDLAEVAQWSCEPLQPLIDGLIALGNLVYFAAMSQTGKTLLALYIMRLCLQGGSLFGKFTVTPVDRLLYLVLEDPARRIQDRLLDMAHDFPELVTEDRNRAILYIAPGFTLSDDRFWPWLELLITREQRRLVFLDTYQKATPGIASYDDEQQSRILHKLADLTRRTGVTLLVLDHVRKQANGGRRGNDLLTLDDIKGTGGKAQNADCVILLERSSDRRCLKLQSFSKDFDVPVRILVQVNPRGSEEPKFAYVGDLDALGNGAKAKGAATRQRILDTMTPESWVSIADIVTALGLSDSTVKRHLGTLIEQGTVEH